MKTERQKKGSALVSALVVSVILLQFAIIYSSMVKESRPSTYQIDERIRLNYLANGFSEIAALKFQKYPSDFYNCWEYKGKDNGAKLKEFTTGAKEFKNIITAADLPSSSFNAKDIAIQLATMTIVTRGKKWSEDVMLIHILANYQSIRENESVQSEIRRTLKLNRTTNTTIVPAQTSH